MKLSDSTRRTVSLLVFFLLGPILTFGILAGIVARKMPSNARRVEQTLNTETGLQWTVDSVEYRTPSVVRLHQVRILDSLTAKPVVFAQNIDITTVSSAQREKYFGNASKTKDTEPSKPSLKSLGNFFYSLLPFRNDTNDFLHITIPESTVKLEVNANDLGNVPATKIRELIFNVQTRLPGSLRRPVILDLNEIDVQCFPDADRTKNERHRIRFVRGCFYRKDDSFRSDWVFQIPEVSETETQRLSFSQKSGPGNFDVEFITGFQPIPCELASIFCATFQNFGSGSRFCGTIKAECRSGNRWTLRLTNAFLNDLNVAPYAAEYTPFSVTGTVKGLQIDSATFSDGVLEAEGWFDVVGGSIEKILFNRLVQDFELKVQPASIFDAPLGSVPFDQCLVYYRLQSDGAMFWAKDPVYNLFMRRYGDGTETQPMSVYFTQRNPRLVSYHAILSTLAPDTAPVVPLTPGSKRILSMIPDDGILKPWKSRPGIQQNVPEVHSPQLYVNSPNAATPTERLMQDARQQFGERQPMPSPATPAPVVAEPWRPKPQSQQPIFEVPALPYDRRRPAPISQPEPGAIAPGSRGTSHITPLR